MPLNTEVDYNNVVIKGTVELGVKGERGLQGFKGDQGVQGPPVPVAHELGDDPELAVSQKLLTDSIADMEQSNSDAVMESTRQAGLAEAARDAAFVNADVYPDVAAGLAAVDDGEQFQVLSDEGLEYRRYRKDSATVATEVGEGFPTPKQVEGAVQQAENAADRAESAESSVEQNAEQIAQEAAQQAASAVIAGVDGQVAVAQSAADRAEAASDSAFVNADVYPDVAAGLAAVADGDQFQVVEGDEIVRYRRDSSSAAVVVARILSADGSAGRLSGVEGAPSLALSNPNLFTENQVAALDGGDKKSIDIIHDSHNGIPCWSSIGTIRRWGMFRRDDITGDTLSAAVRILDWAGLSARFLIIQYSSPTKQEGEVARHEVIKLQAEFNPGFLRIDGVPIHEECQSIGFFIGGSSLDSGSTIKYRDMLLSSGGDATFRVPATAIALREVWVSPDGSDNGSGSSSLPFATLARAVAEVGGRGTIYLAAGSYDGQQISARDVKELKIVGGADSTFERSLFRHGSKLTLSAVSGRTGVFSAALTRSVSWLWVDGLADEQTLVPYNEQHSLLNGRAHRLECTKIWHIPADNLGDALDLIEMSATPVCWRDTSTNTVYLSLPEGADIGSEIYGAFDDIGLFSDVRPLWTPEAHIELVGIDIRYSYINTKSFRTSSLTDVRVVGAANNGFNIGNWAELNLCSAGGCGSGSGLGDGFNSHNHAIWTYRDCYGHDNWDDGESSHQNCKVTGWGNIMEYNGGSGFTPALGAQEILHNCLSRKNATSAFRTGGKMGGFQVAGDPTATDPGIITSLEAYNCVSIGDRNGFHDGTASAVPTQRRLLAVNCKVFDAEETAFACAEIWDCREDGSAQTKMTATVVRNTNVVA